MSDLERLLETSNKLFSAGYRAGYKDGYAVAIEDAMRLIKTEFMPPESSVVTPITKAAP